MKIKCNFCGTAFNDTEEKCPHCGAPNEGIVRTASDQPVTIEQLKQWYKDRGLPPSNVTRFFIGEDYRQPRAFGIYKDENTGVCTVYKNKDNGERAIRYEGTDEAYAVNELYQRLKQEIIQQKMNGVKKNNSSPINSSKVANTKSSNWLVSLFKSSFGVIGFGILAVVGMFLIIAVIGVVIVLTSPKEGYYDYNGTNYYFCFEGYAGNSEACYYRLENGEWVGAINISDMPEDMQGRHKSKKYFIDGKWNSGLNMPDFAQSVFSADMSRGYNIKKGYYQYDDIFYYNLDERFDSGWYIYEGEWQPEEFDSLPKELRHSSLAEEYFYDDAYSESIQTSDFESTIYYRDSIADTDISKGYYSCDDRYFYHIESDYQSGWYEYSYSDWSDVDYDELPGDLKHNSIVNDFYYTPTWDASTQITDFTTSYAYEEYVDSHSSSSSDDSDYDWDSGSSWDSGDTDFGSDW